MTIDPDEFLIFANFHLSELFSRPTTVFWILSFVLYRIAVSVSLCRRIKDELFKIVIWGDFWGVGKVHHDFFLVVLWHLVFTVESRWCTAITVIAFDITKSFTMAVAIINPILNELDSNKFDVHVHQIGWMLIWPLEIVLISQFRRITPSFKFPKCELRPREIAKWSVEQMFHFIFLLLYKLSDLATDYLDLFLGLLLVVVPVELVLLQQNIKLLVVKFQAVKVGSDTSS